MKTALPPIEQLRPLVAHYSEPYINTYGRVQSRPLCKQKAMSGKGYTAGLMVANPTMVTCKKCARRLERMQPYLDALAALDDMCKS